MTKPREISFQSHTPGAAYANQSKAARLAYLAKYATDKVVQCFSRCFQWVRYREIGRLGRGQVGIRPEVGTRPQNSPPNVEPVSSTIYKFSILTLLNWFDNQFIRFL